MELHSGQYLGATPLRKQLPGVIIAQSEHEAHSRIPPHYHTNPHFTLVMAGHYAEVCEGREHQYRRGDLIFHPAHTEHRNVFYQPPAACLNVEIAADCYNQLGRGLRDVRQYTTISNPQQKQLVLGIIRELKDADAFSEAIVLGKALELAGGFLRAQQPRPEPRCVRLVKTLLADVPQHNPSLLELSRVAEVAPDYLCREFKRSVGLTLGEYMRRQKVARACTLLAQPALSTEEIAFRVGFADASHLNKAFQKVLGTSPSGYRQGLR